MGMEMDRDMKYPDRRKGWLHGIFHISCDRVGDHSFGGEPDPFRKRCGPGRNLVSHLPACRGCAPSLGCIYLIGWYFRPPGRDRFMQKNLGNWAALLLPLSSRLSLTLVAATGLVATAGFVFNEVFVYWFPNFLFAYLLLGLILIVNLLGRVVWGRFQLLEDP